MNVKSWISRLPNTKQKQQMQRSIATELDTYVQTVRDAREHERVAKSNRQSAQQVQEYVAQQITVHDQDLTEDNPNPFLVQLLGYAAEMVKKAEEEV